VVRNEKKLLLPVSHDDLRWHLCLRGRAAGTRPGCLLVCARQEHRRTPPEEIVGHEKRESLSLTVRAEILGWAGYLAGAYSDLDLAVHHLNQSLELLRQAGDRTLLGDILSKLGVMEISGAITSALKVY
jgi:hypothetical protein